MSAWTATFAHLAGLLLALLLASMPLHADPGSDPGAPIRLAALDTERLFNSPDALLAKTLQNIRASRLDTAMQEVDRLIALRPDFKLAHLIRGDLLLARARPLSTLGSAPAGRAGQSLDDLREEARVRLLRYIDEPAPELLPLQLLQLAPSHRYALLADAERARLYVFENVAGEPRLVRDYYMTVGRNGVNKQVEGDRKTPLGLYTVTDRIPPRRLSDFYGAGAFPISYPNEWDLAQGRTGHGIWIHGTPSNTYSRPPKASDGCVVIANPDFEDLAQYIEVGVTPIVIGERTQWVNREAWLEQRESLLALLDAWKTTWENRDADRFLQLYDAHFLSGPAGRGWGENKRRNILNKDWIRLGLEDVSVFLYPSGDMAVITFRQDYRSDKLQSSGMKRLYLQLDGKNWRIALERNLPAPRQVASTRR